MNQDQITLARNIFLLYLGVYAILAYIGGSVNIIEWGVNAKLLLTACVIKQFHFHTVNGY